MSKTVGAISNTINAMGFSPPIKRCRTRCVRKDVCEKRECECEQRQYEEYY